ncbi:hypothetical protein [Actinoplanes regularis]|uniref:hypothetical protein n=1 Tax=Actinoplanes regularis TaxID=52697 RepID=UPI0025521C10|nr:hypothetical protein [Actinoplanes regularis]
MRIRRALTLAGVVALVAAAAAVLVTLGRAALTPSSVAAAPAVTDSTWPYHSPAPAESGSPPPPGRPGRTATASALPAVSPAPFVQHFADGPTAGPQPMRRSPTAPLKVPAFVDGCDHNYGTRTQCVPLAFPDGVTGAAGKCSWLAAHGFTGLIVAGRDVQGLDADGDGTACD